MVLQCRCQYDNDDDLFNVYFMRSSVLRNACKLFSFSKWKQKSWINKLHISMAQNCAHMHVCVCECTWKQQQIKQSIIKFNSSTLTRIGWNNPKCMIFNNNHPTILQSPSHPFLPFFTIFVAIRFVFLRAVEIGRVTNVDSFFLSFFSLFLSFYFQSHP